MAASASHAGHHGRKKEFHTITRKKLNFDHRLHLINHTDMVVLVVLFPDPNHFHKFERETSFEASLNGGGLSVKHKEERLRERRAQIIPLAAHSSNSAHFDHHDRQETMDVYFVEGSEKKLFQVFQSRLVKPGQFLHICNKHLQLKFDAHITQEELYSQLRSEHHFKVKEYPHSPEMKSIQYSGPEEHHHEEDHHAAPFSEHILDHDLKMLEISE